MRHARHCNPSNQTEWSQALRLVFTTDLSLLPRAVGLLAGSPLDITPPGLQSDQPAGGENLPEVCRALPGLSPQQVNLCSRLPETVESVPFGTARGLVECEYQFRNELWNCSDNRESRRIQQTIERGSKETAFLYAVTSAGVVHTIARDCASGNYTEQC